MNLSILPTLNAILNGTSAVLLTVGYLLIRNHKVQAHRIAMTLAFLTSTLFLGSYLFYHAHHGATRFAGTGWVRPIYFTILISHTFLAIVIVPLALRTLYLALNSRFQEHQWIARRTLPLWLYVSVTGVVVYWMLYQVKWAWPCPMCREVVSSQSDAAAATHLINGFAWSLGLLLCTPYLLFAGITFLIVRSARRTNRTARSQ